MATLVERRRRAVPVVRDQIGSAACGGEMLAPSGAGGRPILASEAGVRRTVGGGLPEQMATAVELGHRAVGVVRERVVTVVQDCEILPSRRASGRPILTIEAGVRRTVRGVLPQ